MTANFKAVVAKNRYIADEVIKYGSIQNKLQGADGSEGPFFTNKPQEATLIERDRQWRYDRRNNRCDVCHTTKSLGTGECLCG